MVSILLLPLAVLGACGAGAAGSHKHSQNLAHYHNHRHHWKHPEPHHTATVTNVAVIHKTHIHPPPITHTAEYVHPHVPHYEPYVPAHPQPYAPTYSQAYEQPYATPHAAPHAQPYVQPYAQPYVQPYAQPYVQTHTKAYVRPYTQTHAQAHVQPYRAPHHHKHAYTYAPEPYIQTTTRDAYPYAAPTPDATVNGQSAYNPQSYASAEVVVSFATAHWPGYADAAPAGHSAITVTYSAQPEPIPTYKSRAQGVVPTTVPPEKIAEDGPAPVGPVSWHPPGEGPATPPGPGPIDADISALVSRLSLREKIGQMAVLPVNVLLDAAGGLSAAAVEYWVGTWSVGAFFSAPGNGINGTRPWYSAQALSDYTDAVQRVALERGANKIPVIWGLDSVRGANFVRGAAMFPSGVGTAATFDPRFAYAAARVAAKDTRAAGYHWSFAPVLDVSVNKLWSRVYESFGEDPHLMSVLARASVRGYQGDYKHDRTRVAACMKHFIGYGYPFDGSDRANRHIAPRELLEYYLPAFKAAVDAGVATAMSSYGAINSEPVTMSRSYLQRLLREKLGFRGALVTDAGEIASQVSLYKTASDIGQATWGALSHTSIDLSMMTADTSFCEVAYGLVVRGYIPESRVDESVARILQLKKDLGLFERPFADRALQATVGSAQDVEDARNAARESITLLKNEGGVLPLRPYDRVLFVGPTLNSTRFMGGGWNVHWQGPSDAEGDAVYQGFGDTVIDGVRAVTGAAPRYLPGVDIDGTELIDIDAVVEAARQADKVVVGLGERTYAEEFGNIGRLTLPEAQLDLVYAIAEAAQKPVVVVLVQGRPRVLERVPDVAAAVVNVYLPGAYGGLPIAEVLYGRVNPSGRLPYTYPATEAQASTTVWQPAYTEYRPQWAFGFGLGYSTVTYSNVTLSCSTIRVGAPITATVRVANSGAVAQRETVMLFTRQPSRFNLAPENYRLRAFKKVDLAPGESKTVSLQLRAEDLAFWDADLKQRIAPSAVIIAINPYTQHAIAAEAHVDADPTSYIDSV